MIRPIGLFDIPSISRLQHQGIQLDLRRALTLPESPLAVALRAPLSLGRPLSYTYIGRPERVSTEQAGFVQLRNRPCERPQADVTYIAPALDSHATTGTLWTELLNAVCWEVGCQGVQQVFADLPADSENMTPFLNAGFVIFAREELLRCEQIAPSASPPRASLRPQEDSDNLPLQRLYAAIVPIGVKQAEGVYEANGSQIGVSSQPLTNGYVVESQGEILGHMEITQGKIGHGVHFAVRPDAAEMAGDMVDAGLQILSDMVAQPVYCHIRTYQSLLKPALLAREFRVIDVRDLAVRQTFARVERPALSSVKVLETRSEVSVTPTLSPHWRQAAGEQKEMACRRGILAPK